jgi:hypothetical protein
VFIKIILSIIKYLYLLLKNIFSKKLNIIIILYLLILILIIPHIIYHLNYILNNINYKLLAEIFILYFYFLIIIFDFIIEYFENFIESKPIKILLVKCMVPFVSKSNNDSTSKSTEECSVDQIVESPNHSEAENSNVNIDSDNDTNNSNNNSTLEDENSYETEDSLEGYIDHNDPLN